MCSVIRKYIKIRSKRVFVQILGKGPAIALLHPSPHSSEMLIPLARKLAQNYTVICIDTPGYGKSDGLENEPASISVYTTMLHRLFKAMDISELSIYGSATGAQLAIRYALEYEDMVSHIFLDNSAHFDEDMLKKVLLNYFPDLTPNDEASHLETLWDIVSSMFQYFPWCFKTEEYALNRLPLPPEALHAIAMDYLKAGSKYAYAYRVAFVHERAEHVQKLKTKTTIFRWEVSIVLPYIDALLSHDLPPNVEVIALDIDAIARMENMVHHIIEKSAGLLQYDFPISLGQDVTENKDKEQSIKLPEITADGSYLLKAWKQLKAQHKTAAPEEVQRLLIKGYKRTNN